jgi:hypothetical protein
MKRMDAAAAAGKKKELAAAGEEGSAGGEGSASAQQVERPAPATRGPAPEIAKGDQPAAGAAAAQAR